MTEFAPGIPSRTVYQELPVIAAPKEWEFAVHEHHADKRGHHYDIRLGDPSTGHAHSWAMMPEWPKPGESTWAIQQPTHTVKYMDFEGEIPKGTYGAGKVTLKDRDRTEVIRSEPGHITFHVYRGKGPEEFTLHQIDDKKWKLYNRTLHREQIPSVPTSKPSYKLVEPADIDFENTKEVMSAKIDDAHNLFLFPRDRQIRVVSYRSTDRPTGVIEHTHKIESLTGVKTPSELAGAVIRGGIYAIHPATEKATPSTILAGLLNSNVWKSREGQKAHGKLRPVIYDVVTWKGKDVSQAPYAEKLEILKAVNKALLQFELPKMAFTKAQKEKLFKEISEGEHPATKEGVVLWPLKTGEPPAKAKLLSEHDVYIREMFKAEPGSKYEDKAVGGFTYSHTPNGKIAGKVGTGFSDVQRKDMHAHPENYIGLVAKVSAQEKHTSGALRAPAFQGFHLDKNTQDKLDMIKLADITTPLEPHQKRLVKRIQRPDQPGLVAAWDVGSGKTLAGLAAANAIHKPTTVVAPASLGENWHQEIKKHTVPGTMPKTNIESLQAIARNKKPIHTGFLIGDEVHRLRNANSASAKAMRNIDAEKRLMLSGTPFYNHPSDFSSPINIAAGQQVLPENPRQFEQKYITNEEVKPGFIDRLRGVKPGMVPHLNRAREEELKDIYGKWVDYHSNAPNSADFPEKNEETVQVPMTRPQQEAYEILMSKAPAWLRLKVRLGLPPNVEEAKTMNAFLNAGRQVSNTTGHIAPKVQLQQPKLERAAQDLQEMLASNQRAKAVAYSNYLESGLNPYGELLKQRGIPFGTFTGQEDKATKARTIQDYNEGKLRALLLSSAGGEGLNLQGTRLMQVLEPHFNDPKIQQVVGRSARYKSHAGLSPEERNVAIKRYLTTYPEQTGFLHRIGLGGKRPLAVDQYMSMLSRNKERLNSEFRALLPPE